MRETWVWFPGLGKSPGEEKGYSLQHSDLENSLDCVVRGFTKSQTRLSDFHTLVDEKIFKCLSISKQGNQKGPEDEVLLSCQADGEIPGGLGSGPQKPATRGWLSLAPGSSSWVVPDCFPGRVCPPCPCSASLAPSSSCLSAEHSWLYTLRFSSIFSITPIIISFLKTWTTSSCSLYGCSCKKAWVLKLNKLGFCCSFNSVTADISINPHKSPFVWFLPCKSLMSTHFCL